MAEMMMTATVRIRKMVAGFGRALPTRSTASIARTIAPFFSKGLFAVFAISNPPLILRLFVKSPLLYTHPRPPAG